ncbi:hypothetical protein Sjap_006429 [Stephania japonica]|uniref:FAD-binding PCMH-type domain-containing protein n=1 Tax=Stephania japonica TaxID=461633 RepID=A0AAP0K5Z0_9MAGN
MVVACDEVQSTKIRGCQDEVEEITPRIYVPPIVDDFIEILGMFRVILLHVESPEILVRTLKEFLKIFYFKVTLNATTEDFLACLNHHEPNIQVYVLGDSSYLPILESGIRNPRFYPHFISPISGPQFIVTPLRDSHVQAAVICSNENHIELKVRSNGHDYEGLSYRSDVPFVMVDMFQMHAVNVDVEEGSAWVEAGATLGEVYYNIAEKSDTYGFPAGICPTVGVGGHISGGGFGTLVRKYGLAADNILDARLVNANGEILDKASMGEDLFWAIRGGGGGNFGAILAWKIKLVPVPKTVSVFSVCKNLEHGATELVLKWQEIAPKLPDDLYIKLLLDRSHPVIVRGVYYTINATFVSLFLGGSPQLYDIMERLIPELGLRREDIQEMSWIQSVLYAAGFDPHAPLEVLLDRNQTGRKQFFKSKSDYVNQPLTVTALEGIWKMFYDKDAEEPHMMWSPQGGAMDRIPPAEIPYPHRKNLYQIEYMVWWDEQGIDAAERNINWIRTLYDYMEPYVTKNPRASYVNFRDLGLGQSKNGTASYEEAKKAWGGKYFMENFDRLVRVKSKVDRGNFFRSEQSIPPTVQHAWKRARDDGQDEACIQVVEAQKRELMLARVQDRDSNAVQFESS